MSALADASTPPPRRLSARDFPFLPARGRRRPVARETGEREGSGDGGPTGC